MATKSGLDLSGIRVLVALAVVLCLAGAFVWAVVKYWLFAT